MAEELVWSADPVAEDELVWEVDNDQSEYAPTTVERQSEVVDYNDPLLGKKALDPSTDVQTPNEERLSNAQSIQQSGGGTLRNTLLGSSEPSEGEQEFVDRQVNTAENLVITEANQRSNDVTMDRARRYSNTLIANAEGDVARLDNIYKNITTGGLTSSNRDELNEINKKIVDIMYGQGHTSVEITGKGTVVWVNPETGEREPLTGGIFKSLMSAKFEIGGGIAGFSAASRIPIPNPYLKGATAIAGGAVGAATGKALDMYSNALDFNLDMTQLPWLDQVATAGAVDAVFALGGKALIKTIGASFKGIKDLLRNKEVDRAMAHLESINPNFRLTKDGLPTEEMAATTDKYLKSYGMDDAAIEAMKAKGGETYKRAVIEAVVTTDPRYSTIIKELAQEDATAVRISKQVKERADVVKKQLGYKQEVTKGQNVVDNLVQANDEAVSLYNKAQATIIKAFDGASVSGQAATAIKNGTDVFIGQVMTDPRLSATLMKGDLGKLFNATTKLGSDVSDMNGVLNLRDSVAQLAKKAKMDDNPYTKEYLQRLDGTIKGVVENNSFLSAKEKIGMLEGLTKGREFVDVSAQTLKTGLFTAIKRGKGKNHDNIMDSFVKYASSEDGMFEKVASTLTTGERNLLENSMIKRITNKNLSGDIIDYDALVKGLENVAPRLQSESGQQSLQLARGMADMFQNDSLLSKLTSELRRGSKTSKPSDIFTVSGSGMGKTLEGKYHTAKASAQWKFLMSSLNSIVDNVFELVTKVPIIGRPIAKLDRSRELIASRQNEAIQTVMRKQIMQDKADFTGFTKDLAQVENLPPKLEKGLKDFIRTYSKLQNNLDSTVSNYTDASKGLGDTYRKPAGNLNRPGATTMSADETAAQGRREFREDVSSRAETKGLPTPDPREVYKRDVLRKWAGQVMPDVEDKGTLKTLVSAVEDAVGTPKQEQHIARLKQYASEEGIILPEQFVQGQLKPKVAGEIAKKEPKVKDRPTLPIDSPSLTKPTEAQTKAKSLLDKALAAGKSIPEATEIYERSIGRSSFTKKVSDNYTRWMRKNPTKVFHHFAKEQGLSMETIEAYYKAKGREIPKILKGE